MNALKLALGLPLVCGLLFFACTLEPVSSVVVGLHQSTRIASSVVVQLDSIQDSRCPVTVYCIWAGIARVRLTLVKENESASIWLASGYGPGSAPTPYKRPDSTNVLLKGTEYRVILQKVNPYPGIGKPGQGQTAMVEVTNLQ